MKKSEEALAFFEYKAFAFLKDIFKRMGKTLKGSVVSLDSAYDSGKNRKKIFRFCRKV
jgi:hypothetical protein